MRTTEPDEEGHVIVEDAPADVLTRLELAGLNHRPVLLTTSTDIARDGAPAQPWLVVTDERVSVVVDAEIRSLRVSEVTSFRSCAAVGSGALQARHEGAWVDLLRYSNTLSDRFHKVAAKLEQLRSTGKLEIHEEDATDPRRCPSCKLRLSSVGESCPRCLPRGAIAQRVWELIRPQRGGAILLGVLTLAGVAAELVPPKLQQHLVDEVLRQAAPSSATVEFFQALLMVVLALAASRIMLSVVGAVKGRLATRIGAALTADLRSRLVQRLQQLAISYYDRHQVGSLMSRVAYDSEVLHGLVHQITAGFLLQILQLVGVGAMLVVLNPKLAMYTLIPVPLVVGSTWFFWRRVYPRYYKYWDASSKQVAALSSMLSGIRVVKGFAQETREYDRFQRSSEYLRTSRLTVEESAANYSAWMQVVFSLGGLIVWYVGGRDVIGQSMTLGSLIAFLAYLAMFYAPLATLSNFTTWLTSFLTGAKRVLELLDTPVTVAEPAQPAAPGPPRGLIRFEDVRFGYDRHEPVLKGISFEVQPGEMVGIVGRSGSGKTTLVNLLGRFYDADDGRILVDGLDVRDYRTNDLRRRIGIVFQETYLFRGTIWDNLTYGMPDATLEQGLAAAKAAGAHDFILRSGLGYETPLGEHGAGLSGGEKQRLSLARALLYDPPILVLDEATSNVDTETERAIQEAIARVTAGRTTIAIAHRLSTLRNADRILVFDRGRLAEQGSHEALLAQDGIYARLVRIQTQLTRDANVDRLADESTPAAPAVPVVARSPIVSAANGSQAPAPADNPSPARHEIRWLEPGRFEFATGDHDTIQLREFAGPTTASVFLVCAFPATASERFLSVRTWDADDEKEIGMLRELADWPEPQRELIRAAIRRRYLFHRIRAIDSLELKNGYLWFEVRTDDGPRSFTMRWSQSQAIDFGREGKMLHDVEDNRFVIESVEQLPPRQRELFERFVYW